MKKLLLSLSISLSITSISQTKGWIVGNNGASYKTTDGGTSWSYASGVNTSSPPFYGINLNGIAFSDANTG